MRAAAIGKKVTLVTAAFVLAVSTLTAAVPFVLAQQASALPGEGNYTITGNTTAVENGDGWIFNRDAANATPTQFAYGNASTGTGALYVQPLSASVGAKKFVGEHFIFTPMSEINEITVDYKLGPATNANQVYLNVYANYAASADTYYYDCRYNVIASTGSTANYTELTFNPAASYSVNTRSGSAQCPASPAAMGEGAKVRAYAINLGDTSTNDAGMSAYFDNARVALASGVRVYDFEPEPYVPTTPPVRPALAGNVVYDSIPTPLPSNLPSIGYQATSTRALGDKITLAGTDRHLEDVAVTMSSWACETGTWNAGCVTTPGATFTHPVTLNIYEVATDGSAGALIGSRTQTFTIPYRPTADPSCAGGTAWRDTNGTCFNGINNVVVFDASGIVVPNSVIYSVAFNTQSYGTAPTGVAGPYTALNVSLSTGAATVGTNNNTDEVFWDTTYPGYTAGLKADSGWAGSGNPAVVFTATTPDTTRPVVTLENTAAATFDSLDRDLVFNATDNVGLNKVVANIYKNGAIYRSTQSAANGATAHTHTIDLATVDGGQPLPVGTYSVRYNATDLAGNLAQTQNFSFTVVDAKKPTVQLVSPTAQITNNGTVAIQVNAQDERGLERIVANIYKDGALYRSTQTAVAGGAKTGTHSASVDLPDGTYSIRYNARDLFGNVAQTGTFTFTIDTEGPTAPTILTPNEGDYINGSSTNNSWTIPEDESAIVAYEVKYDFEGRPSATRTTTTNSRTQTFSGSYEGPITISVRAQDAAGNWSDWSAEVTYFYGLEEPTEPTEGGEGDGEDTTGGPIGGGENEPTQGGVSQPTPLGAEDDNTGSDVAANQLPLAFNQAAILGTGNTVADNSEETETTPSEEVEGSSTESTLAQAVDADNTDGTAMGLAWYWWLLIIAGGATGLWWVIAALRGRSAQ